MKGIQAVDSSNVMINVVSYILKKNVRSLQTLPTTFDLLLHISRFFISEYEEQKPRLCSVSTKNWDEK